MASPLKRQLLSGVAGTAKRPANGLVSSASSVASSPGASDFDDLPRVQNDSPVWQQTIQGVVRSVVLIHFAQVAPFDLDLAVVLQASGFVVDAARGIILTNRHVVGAGPFWGYAVFDNHEEVVVKPVYRDPVHDFGFLTFDPAAVRHMAVEALELRPDLAKIGREIRVVGNDAGEKLSILAGFISRLDRNAPEYGHMTYNDFNTEYIQAAAAASGGSLGLPVVDIDGYAVALQAGGSTEALTDFFLPVSRPLRALQCMQTGTPITRGTIQVQWLLRPYDECRRLGLTEEAEEAARTAFPDKIGLLVAEVILPEGPADSLIKEGDVLLAINGTPILTFITVDDIFDSSVGQSAAIRLQRGGVDVEVNIPVGDLHAITPNRYVEVCGALFNDMSYQMARIYLVPVRGVFVSNALGLFFFDKEEPCGWIVDAVDDRDTPTLDAFVEVMRTIPDRAKVLVQFRHLTDLHLHNHSVISIDRHWLRHFRMATRNDTTGVWDYTSLQDAPLPSVALTPKAARFLDIPMEPAACAALSRLMVLVSLKLTVPMDLFPLARKRGHGVVLDASRGFVLVLRYIVPHDPCDVDIVFAESVIVPAKVVFLHPQHNYAVVQYDPALVQADVTTPRFLDTPLRKGDKVQFIGFNSNMRVMSDPTKVSDVLLVNVPCLLVYPRYRGTNLEAITVDLPLLGNCLLGVLCDDDGTVRAFWVSCLGDRNGDQDTVYRMGIDTADAMEVITRFQQPQALAPAVDGPDALRIIDAEFYGLPILQARIRGVAEPHITNLQDQPLDRFQFLCVLRVSAPAFGQTRCALLPGDIVLAVDGVSVHRVRDLNRVLQRPRLVFTVVRRKREVEVEVEPVATSGDFHTLRLVLWCGAMLQAPHHGVRQMSRELPLAVYVTERAQGLPARMYGLQPLLFITHVNEHATPDLEAFVAAVKAIPDAAYVTLRVVLFDNVKCAMSLKTNYHYFPTSEMVRQNGEWESVESEDAKD